MTDEQAERLIRELRRLRAVLFLAGAVAAVAVGIWLGTAAVGGSPLAGVQAEPAGVRAELQQLGRQVGQAHAPPPVVIPVPPAKPPEGKP
jgi:hypothetical protein